MKPPLRLFMTADAVGGVWTYGLDLSAELAASGVQVTLAVLGPAPNDAQRRDASAIAGLKLIETGLELDWTTRDPGAARAAAKALRALVQQLAPDVVHLNSPSLAAAGPCPAPVLGVSHSCHATWWSAVKGGAAPDDFAWRARLLREGLLACDLVVTPTCSFATATARAYDIAPPLVVLNGRPPAPEGPPRRGAPFVFTAGRLWDEGKNVQTLDRAAAISPLPVVAAGPLKGPDGSSCAELTSARALGPLSHRQVGRWLCRASVYASSARYEPFGLGVLEAAQNGCALVLSDIPTFRELWDGAAMFADPGDAPGFAAHFERLGANPPERRRLGELALARSARFSSAALGQTMHALYSRLLATDRGRTAA